MALHNYAPRTIAAYVGHIASFAQQFGRSPEHLGAAPLGTAWWWCRVRARSDRHAAHRGRAGRGGRGGGQGF
jgi:hypothetical protein